MVLISDMLSSTDCTAATQYQFRSSDSIEVECLSDYRTDKTPVSLLLHNSELPLSCKYRAHLIILSLQADRVREVNPHWDDEDIFQAARRRVIASLQSIIMYEYLPAFLGDSLKPYEGYKPDTHPGISHVFQSAAFRFFVSLKDREIA